MSNWEDFSVYDRDYVKRIDIPEFTRGSIKDTNLRFDHARWRGDGI